MKLLVCRGLLRFVSLDLPLSIHSNASLAAQAARCALDENKYWEMWEFLHTVGDLSRPSLNLQAQKLGLDNKTFSDCLDTHKYERSVQDETTSANKLSIMGTPSFVLGRASKDRITGELLVGAIPYAVMEKTILNLLRDSKQEPTVEVVQAKSN